jgi:predicted MarR family transcription regulator
MEAVVPEEFLLGPYRAKRVEGVCEVRCWTEVIEEHAFVVETVIFRRWSRACSATAGARHLSPTEKTMRYLRYPRGISVKKCSYL